MNFFAIIGLVIVVIAFLFLINTAIRYYNGKNYTNQLIASITLGFLGWVFIYAATGEESDNIAGTGSGGAGVSVVQSQSTTLQNIEPEEEGIIQKILKMLFGEDEDNPTNPVANKLDESSANGNLSQADAEEIKRQLGQLDPNDPNRPPTVNQTLDQFVTNFNAAAQNISSSYLIRNIRTTSAAMRKDFSYSFTDQIGIIGSVDPLTDKILTSSIISRVTTENSKRQSVIAFNILIATISPELSPEQRSALIQELNLNAEEFPTTAQAERGNVTYTVNAGKRSGIALTATAK